MKKKEEIMLSNKLQKVNLSEKAYQTIKDRIINGELKPGDELSEISVSESLGISRTPLREGLYRLQAEGFVNMVPNKGFYVRKLDFKDIIEISQVREALEGMAARLACTKLTEIEIREILSWYPPFDCELSGSGRIKAYEAGIKLHRLIRDKADNSYLKQQLDYFDFQIQRTVQLSSAVDGRSEKAFTEHKAIIDAFIARDPDQAEKKMREHLANTMHSLIGL